MSLVSVALFSLLTISAVGAESDPLPKLLGHADGKVKRTHVSAEQPNVILIMTDDQGYGDLGCHGNPILKTPHLDRFYEESIRFTDFHVSSFCTPTRAALMTGRYPGRTGAYRTSSGRTMMHTDEETIADVFGASGYATGMVENGTAGGAYFTEVEAL